jgi:3-(3-hydroxy-phenyl)propionate hydroxylase
MPSQAESSDVRKRRCVADRLTALPLPLERRLGVVTDVEMNQRRVDVDVAIVGAGPCGLTMANLLGLSGLSVIVLEKNESTVDEPRAVSIDDESLRTMQAIGLADEVTSRAMLDYGSLYVDANGKSFAFVHPTTREFGYPRRNAFHQDILEDQLRRGLDRCPHVGLLFRHEVIAFQQRLGHVEVDVRTPDGGRRAIRATFLIACDGARSTVRSLLGIAMSGHTYRERWLIVDIEDTKDECRHTRVMCDPARPGITLPGPGGTRRFEFRLNVGETEEDMLREPVVRGLMRRAGPDGDARIRRKVVYAFHARMAERWREGRVFLAGDAAHLSPPFAGQGMNSGVRDAHNLAWKIAAVVQGTLGQGALDSYETERRPHAWALILMAVRMGRVFMPPSPAVARATCTLFRLAGRYPPLRDYFSQMKYKPKPRFAAGLFVSDGRGARHTRTGRLFPQPVLETADGDHVLLDDVLRNRFACIAYSANPGRLFDATNDPLFDRLDVVHVGIVPASSPLVGEVPGAHILRDHNGDVGSYCAGTESLVLLRPDRYVMAVLPPATPRQVLDRLVALVRATDEPAGGAVRGMS